MVRPADQKDAEGLAALLWQLTDALPRFKLEPPEATVRATVRRVAEALEAGDSPHTVLVTEAAGKITGFIHTHWQTSFLHSGGEGFVSALFVHPEHRGQGLGRALVAHIQVEGARRGCSRLLLLNMRDRASYERGFYAKLGWKERPEAANFVFNLEGNAS